MNAGQRTGVPAGFIPDPRGTIAYGPSAGDVYTVWTADRTVEVMVREDAAGAHTPDGARQLAADLHTVLAALTGLGVAR